MSPEELSNGGSTRAAEGVGGGRVGLVLGLLLSAGRLRSGRRRLERGRKLAIVGAILASAAMAATSASAAEDELPSAEELLARSIEYHDPGGRMLAGEHRLWFLETRPDGVDRRTEVAIDIPGERFEMRREGERVVAGVVDRGRCEMTLDGRSEVTDAERAEFRLGCERIRTMRDYYTYLWALPMKLRDPGTRLGRVSATELEERPVYDLRVTYDDAVGEDTWYFYFERESYALVGYRFYHDEAKNDGEVIALEDEVRAEGLRLPKRRTWTTHADGRVLGTDHLLTIAGPSPAGDP